MPLSCKEPYDIESLNDNLNYHAERNRIDKLFEIRMELDELQKIGYVYDQDEMVRNLKSMSSEERELYDQKLLSKKMKKYLENSLTKYTNDRRNTKNND